MTTLDLPCTGDRIRDKPAFRLEGVGLPGSEARLVQDPMVHEGTRRTAHPGTQLVSSSDERARFTHHRRAAASLWWPSAAMNPDTHRSDTLPLRWLPRIDWKEGERTASSLNILSA